MRVGRRRTKNLKCPSGVREVNGRWYWQPTSKRERDARLKAGLPMTVPLGPAGTEARRAWAKLAGFDDAPAEAAGTVAEIIALFTVHGIATKPNGKARAAKTIAEYRRDLAAMRASFGACRYGKTEYEASRGQALGVVDLQQYVAENEKKVSANRQLSALSAAFSFAIRRGRTTYNPCLGVARNAEEPRTREPQAWEVECLRAVADALPDPLLALLIDFEGVAGWRVSDMRRLQRQQLLAAGIRLQQGKRGRRQIWGWTEELRRIVTEASALPGAKGSMFIFPSRSGEMLTLDAFEKRWSRLKRRTNALLSACEVPLVIADLHFQDLRSKAGDDALDAGMNIATFLGNDPAVADRHYQRREQKVRPLR